MLKVRDWPPFSLSEFGRQRHFCHYGVCEAHHFHAAWCPRFTLAEQADARKAPPTPISIDIVLE